jgi:hypothetical protein
MVPVAVSTARRVASPMKRLWVKINRRRRSTRSTKAPDQEPITMNGSSEHVPSSPRSTPLPVSLRRSHDSATPWVIVPEAERV